MRLVGNSDANFFGFVKVPLIAANSIPITLPTSSISAHAH